MNLDRLYKYSTLSLLFFTSGVLFFIVGLIDNDSYRYKIFDIFQFGMDNLFKLVDLKFHTNKDNTIWVSYYNIAPIVNFLSSVFWTGFILILLRMFKKSSDINSSKETNGLWRNVFITNLTLSLFLFFFWLCFIDLNFMYDGVYSASTSIYSQIFGYFAMLMFLPSTIPGIIGSVTLDQGGDTNHGYTDMYLASKTVTSFALTVWAIIVVYIYNKIKMKRSSKLKTSKQ